MNFRLKICPSSQATNLSQIHVDTICAQNVGKAQRTPFVGALLNCIFYLAPIDWVEGQYGRILTEVVSSDQLQWVLYTQPRSRFSHTDWLSLVNEMFIIWCKQEQVNSFNATVLTDILLANSDELNFVLPKFVPFPV